MALAPAQQDQPKGFFPELSETVDVTPAFPTATSTPPTIITATSTSTDATSSDLPLADTPILAVPTDRQTFTAPAASDAPSADPTPAQSSEFNNDSPLLPAETSTPPPSTTTLVSLASGDASAGVIAPDQGSNNAPLSLPSNSSANIGGMVGGVIGGAASLTLLIGLLFFCLKKRKSKQDGWDEKGYAGPGLVERLKSLPVGMGVFVAKLKGKKTGPTSNPYQRHTVQSSVGSVYSQTTAGRNRSASEPEGFFGVKRADSARSSSSRKSDRNLLRKKQSSASINYRFPPITEDLAQQGGGVSVNPFSDPEPPRTLALLNPDPWSQPVTPLAPAPVADPFTSSLDRPVDATDSRKLTIPFHRRNISSLSALSSHPPSLLLSQGNSIEELGPSATPNRAAASSLSRPTLQTQPSYSDALSSVSRDSNYTFFGEPGPSRPGTNLFTPALPTGRTVRQSDPFDLDRPEVLGLGGLTRQGTRSKRTSSFGTWTNGPLGSSGPYDRDSAKPRPLWSAGNQR